MIFKAFKTEFLQRVKCLVFTDAMYHTMLMGLPKADLKKLVDMSIHFKAEGFLQNSNVDEASTVG